MFLSGASRCLETTLVLGKERKGHEPETERKGETGVEERKDKRVEGRGEGKVEGRKYE
jgi:hypothetical protein